MNPATTRRTVQLAIMLSAVVAGCWLALPKAAAIVKGKAVAPATPASAGVGRIYFESSPASGAVRDIRVMNPDGSGETVLTNDSSGNRFPSLSPDGMKLAFISDRDGNREVYVMNADGSNTTKIVDAGDNGSVKAPRWSPDGVKFTFTSTTYSLFVPQPPQIMIANADGTNVVNPNITGSLADWSPDGNRFVFLARLTSDPTNVSSGMFVSHTDGSDRVRIRLDGGVARWSPFGGPATTYSLGGFVKDKDNGNGPLRNAVVKVEGSASLETITDANGHYLFEYLSGGGNYTVTPSKTYHTFAPPSRSISGLSANTVLPDFTGDTPAPYPVPVGDSQIVFSSNSNADLFQKIFIMNGDGSQRTRLTYTDRANDEQPVLSPDGRRIAFISDREPAGSDFIVSSRDLFVMDVDGTNIVRLTNSATIKSNPRWSPDGARLVFSASAGLGENQNVTSLYAINADGTNLQRLTFSEPCSGCPTARNDLEPVFSPNGGKIAFVARGAGLFNGDDFELYTINPAPESGSNARQQLSNDGSDARFPAWSPDGSRIALAVGPASFNIYSTAADIFTIAATGAASSVIQLTNSEAFDGSPTYSPDGSRIAFVSYRNNVYNIYSMNAADGSNEVQLTTVDSNLAPHWGRANLPNPQVCLQDAAGSSNRMTVNLSTGDYTFSSCTGFTSSGRGTIGNLNETCKMIAKRKVAINEKFRRDHQ